MISGVPTDRTAQKTALIGAIRQAEGTSLGGQTINGSFLSPSTSVFSKPGGVKVFGETFVEKHPLRPHF